MLLRYAQNLTHRAEQRFSACQVLLKGVCPGCYGSHPLANQGRGVRHSPNHGSFRGKVLFQYGRGDSRGNGDHQAPGGSAGAISFNTATMSCGLIASSSVSAREAASAAETAVTP